ncbi:MAG: hypothetical protein KBB14_16160, partial [Thermoanaerobaculia bacterium]|nr:hypothetical protein [Thermoanaerobaculia bacterium]
AYRARPRRAPEADVDAGTLVLVHLHSPKEKYWGALRALTPAGVTVRGIDVALFDDWARQFLSGGEPELGVTTLFLPLHRVEKMFEDSRVGTVAAYHERFFEMVGRDVRDVLRLDSSRPDGPLQ